MTSAFPSAFPSAFTTPGGSGTATPVDPIQGEKLAIILAAMTKEEWGDRLYDPEKGDADMERPFLLGHAVMIGLAMVLVVVVEMACIAKVRTPQHFRQQHANETIAAYRSPAGREISSIPLGR